MGNFVAKNNKDQHNTAIVRDRAMKTTFRYCHLATIVCMLLCMHLHALGQNENISKAKVPPVKHPTIGTTSTQQGDVKLQIISQKQNFGGALKQNRDTDIWSPKSVHFHPNGKKFYVNSLEGGLTLVYDAQTGHKLKVIKHVWKPEHASLWAKPSGLYPFTHYQNRSAEQQNTFFGKPVESTFSHQGRYLWIPYYRRSFDINAQDPSAIAVIDTRTDAVVRLMETGPLPKMVATSHDSRTLAVTHWGDNTVGLIDISSNNPADWHHTQCITIDHKLQLNFSLTQSVDRDANSGLLLRGTVFTPDDSHLLVSCMGGAGGIAVIDLKHNKYLGRLTGVHNARHLVIEERLSICQPHTWQAWCNACP